MPPRLSILVADDNPTDSLILSTLLCRQGHYAITASNGDQAVEAFRQHRPDLVLMDLLMPVMDGLEAARRIKQLAGDQLVPIIFLTSMAESEALVSCLEAGGDDFLTKPYNPIILEAKILAMNRLRLLQATVLEQRDLIARQHRQLLQEQRLAKAIFDKVAHTGCLDGPNIRYQQSPLALFNGDLLLAARAPTGHLLVLLGDFTGHGLPAAVGAMPLAETFYGMTTKGYSSGEILCELNAKLVRILPVEVFCCAVLLDIDMQHRTLKVWNGGLPDAHLLRADGSRQPLSSHHLPLGVVEPERFSDTFESYALSFGDRLLLYSDGLLETANADGEMFGEQRLLDVLDGTARGNLFERLNQALAEFHGTTQDDLTLVEICLDESMNLSPLPVLPAVDQQRGPSDWSTTLELRGETLRRFNPLPLLLQLLLQMRSLHRHAGSVFTVLAELYANALEHGVLALDSSLKRNAEGFARYYELRAERLGALAEGEVRIRMDFRPLPVGWELRLTVADSGAGFDMEQVLAGEYSPASLSGRGLRLVRQLSDRLEWSASERGVTAVFTWSEEDDH